MDVDTHPCSTHFYHQTHLKPCTEWARELMQVRTKPGRMGSYVDEFTSPVHTCMGICAGMKRLGIGMSDQY